MLMTEVVRASDITFNEGVLRLAAVHGRVAEFRYAKSPSAPIEHRSFVPESVYHTRDGHIVIVGPDQDREGQTRSYRLDRIKGEVSIPVRPADRVEQRWAAAPVVAIRYGVAGGAAPDRRRVDRYLRDRRADRGHPRADSRPGGLLMESRRSWAARLVTYAAALVFCVVVWYVILAALV